MVSAEPVTGPPINLTAAVNGSTVTLAWTAPTFQDAPVISYLIDVGSTPNFAVPDLVSLDTFSTSTTLVASGVAPGTYYVRIRARNALGHSAASNEAQLVVGDIVVGPACPGAPRSLAGTGSTGTVTMSWLAPLSVTPQTTYLVEAGSAPGAANLAIFNNGPSTAVARAGVPPGVYYVRVRAVAPGCVSSAASNELVLTVSGAGGSSPNVTLRLVYTCNPCTGDPDNYELNVDCTAGRCQTFRTSNARASGTITASLRMNPGVHNVEVVVRNPSAPWSLTVSGGLPNGAMVPGSWRILYPPGGAGLSLAPCGITGTAIEPFLEFRVTAAGGPTC
jgi:hypothetical protein